MEKHTVRAEGPRCLLTTPAGRILHGGRASNPSGGSLALKLYVSQCE